jgi:hypothetical protein
LQLDDKFHSSIIAGFDHTSRSDHTIPPHA